MSRGQARKGGAGERELAALLQRLLGFNMVRGGVSFGEKPDIEGLPGIHIECKRVERLNLHEAMKQSIRDASWFRDGAPTVFHRRNREGWLVTMRLEDWAELYRQGGPHEQGEEHNEHGQGNHRPGEGQDE